MLLAGAGDRPAGSRRSHTVAQSKREAVISTEVELKLVVPRDDLPVLKRTLTAKAPEAVSTQERLIGTYYDTPDLALKKRGLTLRVREQNGQFTQTVKAVEPGAGDILSRGEWEDAVADNRPEPSAAQSGPHLPQDLAGDLRPIFVTEVARTIVDIEPVPGTAIEVAVDEGEIRIVDGDGNEPITVIEFELKGGDAAALYDLALHLLETAPIRIETRSKSERGYRLMDGGEPAAAVHARPVTLDREMTVEQALQRIGRSCLAQLLRNEAAVLAAQPEGVHQMRVAVRRLRSVFSSLKKLLPEEQRRWVTEELRWLGGALGAARNLDVFAAELVPAARAAMPQEPGWDELAATLDRLRRDAYEEVTKTILSERYTAAALRLLRWFEGCDWRGEPSPGEPDPIMLPIGKVAPSVLKRRRRKVARRSKQFGRLTPPERHKLRIAAKKLRYTIELFGSLFDQDETAGFLKKLKRLQSDLGYANDVRVAHEFLSDLFAQLDPRSSAAHAWVAVLEVHDQILAGDERELRKYLDRLNEATPFWRN
jgi:triphosphatase